MIKFEDLEIQENIDISKFTTMKLGGSAKFFTVIKDVEDVFAAIRFAKGNNLKIAILGHGSNTIVRDEGFQGIVLKNEILGRELKEDNPEFKSFRVGSGENWDEFCRYITLEEQLSGCEAMVMIPGSVGAFPTQNVGAYGQEASSIIEGCEVVDLESSEVKYVTKSECELGYRTSIFRTHSAGKYFITKVDFKFYKKQQKTTLYHSVERYFKEKGVDTKNVTPRQILESVEFLRKEKLPDPKDVPSAGSFFKNVELTDKNQVDEFVKNFPDAPVFEGNGKWKIPSGWLIESVGLRGKIIHGMRPHDKNALVLTNISAKSYEDLALAREEIRAKVKEKFGFEIEQEPFEI